MLVAMDASTLFVSVVLVCCGVFHVVPAAGALGPRALERLYGISPTSPTELLLLRHRAVLFGVVGCGMLWGAQEAAMQGPALVMATVCVLGFLLLWPARSTLPPQLLRVRRVDLGLAVLLALAWMVRFTTST